MHKQTIVIYIGVFFVRAQEDDSSRSWSVMSHASWTELSFIRSLRCVELVWIYTVD